MAFELRKRKYYIYFVFSFYITRDFQFCYYCYFNFLHDLMVPSKFGEFLGVYCIGKNNPKIASNDIMVMNGNFL